MDRMAARALAAQTLEETTLFQAVYPSRRRTFSGQSPIAVVSSAGFDEAQTRSGVAPSRLSVSLYLLAPDGSEDATEDQLDALVAVSIAALRRATFSVGASDAAPSGAPLRNIEGKIYRVEQLTLHKL